MTSTVRTKGEGESILKLTLVDRREERLRDTTVDANLYDFQILDFSD